MIYRHWNNVAGKHLALGDAKRKYHSFTRFDGIQHVRPNERDLFAVSDGNNSRTLPVDLLNDSYHSNLVPEASNENPTLLYSLLPLKSESHFRRTANWSSSTLVNTTPIPTFGKTNTTFPRAVNEALA